MARQPWRAAAAHRAAAEIERSVPPASVTNAEWHVVAALLARPDRLLQTSSIGRLFDAVASIIGLCHSARFEGQAAMMLESVSDVSARRRYAIAIGRGAPWTTDVIPMMRAIDDDVRAGVRAAEIGGAFHRALADLILTGCVRIREETGIGTVALSGGVFMNALLLSLADESLRNARFRVLLHREVPCNDGGVSLGQASIAACAMGDTACA